MKKLTIVFLVILSGTIISMLFAGNKKDYCKGCEVQQLTFGEGKNSDPYWHPEGELLLYSHADSLDKYSNRDIYSINILTNETKQITDTPDWIEGNPQYSPNGEYISYRKSNADVTMIKVIDLKGKPVGEYVKTKRPASLIYSWSPDSKKIVFSDNWEIRVLDIATSKVGPPIIKDGAWPVWSNDGKNILYTKGTELVVYNLGSKTESIILQNKSDNWCSSWSPNDEWVSYHSKVQIKKMPTSFLKLPVWNIFIVNTKTKKVKQLTNNKMHSDDPVISPSGKYIVFSQRPGGMFKKNGHSHIYLMKLPEPLK